MSNSLHLNIQTPCHESWQNMQPNEKGRHCLSCQKTVVDFSIMSDREIIDYVSNTGVDICGRFDRHQLNRGLKENETKKKYGWMYIWNLLLVFFVFGYKAKAQGAVKGNKYQLIQKSMSLKGKLAVKVIGDTVATPAPKSSLAGRVVNEETGEPIAFASVATPTGGTATDSMGNFLLPVTVDDSMEITVSSIGFASQTFAMPALSPEGMTFYLKPEPNKLEEVVVTGFNTDYTNMISGGMTTVRTVTTYEALTRKWLLHKKEIIAFPNPLPAGNSMNVSLQLKESGQYRLELFDATGKIVWIQQANIPSQSFNISIPTKSTWSAGLYWLRVSGKHTRKVYNSQVVIQ